MAENEILDVGNPRRYRVWRATALDVATAPASSAECLYDEFANVLKKELRRQPLYGVLRACGKDPNLLKEAVAAFKNRSLAKMVELAYRLANSRNASEVAEKLGQLLIDRVIDRSNRYLLRKDLKESRRSALETAAVSKLQACKPEVVALLTASLLNLPVDAPRRPASTPRTHELLLSKSLVNKDPVPA